jgi:hypothetical protein
MFIIPGKVVRHSTLTGMHPSAAKSLLVNFFTRRSFDERWSSQEHTPLLSHDDIFICHGWDICTTYTFVRTNWVMILASKPLTRNRDAMNNGDLGNTECGHLSLSKASATTFYNVQKHYHVVEYATKVFLVWENLRIHARIRNCRTFNDDERIHWLGVEVLHLLIPLSRKSLKRGNK